MDEKLEELAKVIRESGAYALKGTTTNKLAEIILAAGYAKRSDTIEEDVLAQIEVAARAIKPNAFAALEEFRAFSGKGPYIDHQIMLLEEECQGARSSADAAIYAIRNLKDKP